jgi:phage antirepressor YoqD-like protein
VWFRNVYGRIIDLGGASIHAWMLEKKYLYIQTAMTELLPTVS